MRYLITLLFAALSLNVVGQIQYPYPYNPDIDNNGFIGNSDLLELLSLYSYEFNAGVLSTDSISAIYYTGQLDYWDCTSSCVGLEGNWKVLDHYLVGTYKSDIYDLGVSDNISNHFWLDHKEVPDPNGQFQSLHIEDMYDESWHFVNEGHQSRSKYSCICQTRTSFFLE